MPRPPLFTAPFVLCGLANLAQSIAFNLFLHFPGFLSRLGADDFQVGLVFGLASVAAIGARPPMGSVMDRRGRRGVILSGGVLNCLVCGLYLTVVRMGPWVYVLRVGHGLAEALLFTALFTYAADHVPAGRRTEGLAIFGVSSMAPMALSGLLGDWILAAGDYRELFLAATGFASISLLLSLPLHDPPRTSVGEDAASHGFWTVLLQRDLLPLWWVGGAFSLALATVFIFLKRFVDETGIGSVGSFFSAYAAAALLMRVGFGWLPDRVGAKRALLPSLAALAAGFVALAAATSGRDVAAAGLLCGIGHGYVFPILFALVVGRAREADRGSAMAIFTALFDLGVVLGGPLFGAISLAAGFSAVYLTAALLLTGASGVFFLWDRRR